MRSLLLIPLLSIALFSCAPRVLLDTRVMNEYRLDSEALSRIQFYITEDVVLTRYENEKQKAATEKGSLTVTNDRMIDQVLIKRGTPGKVVKVLSDSRLAVSFEPDESRYLVFAPTKGNGAYQLVAKQWQGDRALIDYAEEVYLSNHGAGKTALGFRLRKSMKVEEKQRVAKGNRVR